MACVWLDANLPLVLRSRSTRDRLCICRRLHREASEWRVILLGLCLNSSASCVCSSGFLPSHAHTQQNSFAIYIYTYIYNTPLACIAFAQNTRINTWRGDDGISTTTTKRRYYADPRCVVQKADDDVRHGRILDPYRTAQRLMLSVKYACIV